MWLLRRRGGQCGCGAGRPHAAEGAAARTVALVGKGIVYDTGGLSLKVGGSMCGMKADCGGAAALLAAFEAAVAIGTGGTALHLVLCLAEVRNDVSRQDLVS